MTYFKVGFIAPIRWLHQYASPSRRFWGVCHLNILKTCAKVFIMLYLYGLTALWHQTYKELDSQRFVNETATAKLIVLVLKPLMHSVALTATTGKGPLSSPVFAVLLSLTNGKRQGHAPRRHARYWRIWFAWKPRTHSIGPVLFFSFKGLIFDVMPGRTWLHVQQIWAW